jgi:hypothetical protein
MLCALVFSAIAAQGAFAQKAYECKASAGKTGDWNDAHCKEEGTKGASAFEHVATTKGTITGSNITTGEERSTAKLKSVQSGVTLELQATEVGGEGEMENHEEGATTWAEGTGTITYSNVTVTAPAGKGCEVETSKVVTNKLAATTKGLTNHLKFTPASGEVFAEFNVKGCSIGALNHTYTAKGSVTGVTSGATTTASHAEVTEANTLSLSGQKAGIDGSITISGPNNPLVLT